MCVCVCVCVCVHYLVVIRISCVTLSSISSRTFSFLPIPNSVFSIPFYSPLLHSFQEFDCERISVGIGRQEDVQKVVQLPRPSHSTQEVRCRYVTLHCTTMTRTFSFLFFIETLFCLLFLFHSCFFALRTQFFILRTEFSSRFLHSHLIFLSID